MNVIWKRPDGYHGATPNDFVTYSVDGSGKLWLHKTDRNTFPFRVSGGWEDEKLSTKLNNLVNGLSVSEEDFVKVLKSDFDNSMFDSPRDYLSDLVTWLDRLTQVVKGDQWEIEIMRGAFAHIRNKAKEIEAEFLKACNP